MGCDWIGPTFRSPDLYRFRPRRRTFVVSTPKEGTDEAAAATFRFAPPLADASKRGPPSDDQYVSLELFDTPGQVSPLAPLAPAQNSARFPASSTIFWVLVPDYFFIELVWWRLAPRRLSQAGDSVSVLPTWLRLTRFAGHGFAII